MKLDFNHKYNTIAVYAVLVVIVSAVAVAGIVNYKEIARFIGEFSALLTPFIIGLVIAYVINPILNTIEHRVLGRLFGEKLPHRANRIISLILTYLLTMVILSVFFSIVIPQIASSITSIAVQVPSWIIKVQDLIDTLLMKFDLQSFQTLQPDTWEQIMLAVKRMISSLSEMLTNAIPHILQTTLKVTTSLLNAILGLIISVYVLLGKERFFAQLKKMLTAFIPTGVVNKIIDITHESHEIFSGFISGKLLDSAIIGVLCFLGMTVFRMPYAMLISVIVGVTNVIPYFGPFIGAIPSILILLIIDPIKAVWFGVFVLALQQLDGNVIGPKILGDSTGLSAFWVIFSITVFGSLLGIVGMFIGVPLFAVIYSLLRQLIDWRLALKKLPTETVQYASDKHALLRESKPPRKKRGWKGKSKEEKNAE